MMEQEDRIKPKRSVIEDQLRKMPEHSNRYIAKRLGVSDKTVGMIRKDLESCAEIPIITHTIGEDGRKQASVRTRIASEPFNSNSRSPSKRVFFAQTVDRLIPHTIDSPATAKPVCAPDPILTQIRIAFAGGNLLAICFGLLLGGFVPVAAWSMIHLEEMEWWHIFLIAGASVFSALTVVDWGTIVFRRLTKALGFAVLVEGVMLGSQLTWLSILALCLLVVINGVNSAVNLVRDTQKF